MRPRRPQSNRGQVRPVKGPIQIGTVNSAVAGDIGIAGNNADESDKDCQPSRFILFCFPFSEYSPGDL